MAEAGVEQREIISGAEKRLKKLGLSWDDLAGRDVLDLGAGTADIAHAAHILGSSARITSLDREPGENWESLSRAVRARLVEADARAMDFPDGSFDYVISHGPLATDPDVFPQVDRVLRQGGELREYPLPVPELWFISYYLDEVKGVDRDAITELLKSLDSEIRATPDALPTRFVELRDEALDNLTQEQKVAVVNMAGQKYRKIHGEDFNYSIIDPQAHEPRARLIYTKP